MRHRARPESWWHDALVRHERMLAALLLLTGLMLRVGWIAVHPGAATVGEATNVAIALAEGRGFADAFFPGQGPTAHLMPISPAIAGFVFHLFGVMTPTSNAILAGWCLVQVGGAFMLCHALFAALGSPVTARLAALAVLCLVPVFIGQETFDYRYWEGALAVVCGVATLLLLVRLDGRRPVAAGWLIVLALLCALTFFISPPLGLGVGVGAALWGWRNLSFRQLPWFAALAALAAVAVIGPWMLRNADVMGKPIPLRDNFGIEFALGNYPGALDPPDPLAARNARIDAIHPARSVALQPVVRRVGEVAYAQSLADRTMHWVHANPGAFARLSVRHLTQYYFPRPWQFAFTGSGSLRTPRAIVVGLISLLGLIGAITAAWRGERRFDYVLLAVVVPALPYALVEPVPRYTYLIYALLAFLAADVVVRWLARWQSTLPRRA